ncbi:MAG: MG2 domain-containing protein [Planctomycetota bacterium]
MSVRRAVRTLLAAAVAVAALVAIRSDTWAARPTTDSLGGPERYLTHLSTDKPIYRVDETVYIRGVLLRANDHKPLTQNARAFIEIKGPKGDTVASGHAGTQDSVLGFKWTVPQGQAGGEYTIKASYPGYGHPPAERTFDIRAYRPPRLKSQIVFLPDGYGPGDEVQATLHVERAEGGIPAGAKVTPIARVDGVQVYRGSTRVGEEGNARVRFKLPPRIERGEGTLALVIEDGGVVETAAKTIPILLQTLDLEIYPEGGDLVAGLPCRVYIEGRTPAKKPADVTGVVVDEQGQPVASFHTEHEGRGRFAFTPRKGVTYTLKIVKPSGIDTPFPLPPVKASGGTLRAVEDVTPKGQAVRLRAGSTSGGRLTLTLSKREVEVSSVSWRAAPGVMANVTLTPPRSADGVLVATLWDEEGKPLAERLVFRRPAKAVRIEVKTDKPSHVPGGEAKVTVTTTDAQGEPVSAVVGLTVTDDSVLEMIETREQAPRLPVMVLLEPEVRELADAHVYLDPADPKAPLATDLLLGTQGWRRFAFVKPKDFLAKHGDAGRRVLAFRMATQRERHKGRGIALGGRWRMDGAEGAALPPKPMAPPPPAAPPPPEEEPADAEARLGGKEELGREMPEKVAKVKDLRKNLGQALEEADKKQRADRLMVGEPMAELKRKRRPRSSFVAVRVYAHKARPGRKPNDRVDFTETLYWCAGIKTDAKTGEATVAFDLSDSVTTFRVFADAFSADGALGQGTGALESVEPFYIEPKMPLEVTAGDLVQLPVSFCNGLDSELAGAELKIQADPELRIEAPRPILLGAKARERRLVALRVGYLNGLGDIVLSASAGPYSDRVTRTLKVVPMGFPIQVASGGMLDARSPAATVVEIPEGLVPRSVTTEIAIYPTPMANLTQALERLIREPHGCFEQTSSTTYPLVMAQQYFLTHSGVDPRLVERSRAQLEKGYKRLTSFECKKRGYEWFGGDPGHEALTAYGLLEFTDMAQVRPVDDAMLRRTRSWLMGQRDGEGGFVRNKRALDSFGRAPEVTTNAYIVWALLEGGETGLEKEIAAVTKAAMTTEDSYVIALGANILALRENPAGARKLMDKLVAKQTDDGWVDGAVTSITRSGGEALKIETTSLAILAWLRQPKYAGAVEKAIRYLANACEAGRYGSTQSTVLALRAIVQYDNARAKPKAAGRARVYVDGQPVGDPVAFDKETKGAITLPDVSELLEPGKHKVEVKMEDGSEMPYSLAVDYHARKPASAEACKLDLRVRLSSEKVTEGGITEANVMVANRSDDGIPMPVAIVGLPGGLEPRHDQLKELVKAGRIAAYEVLGREVVLYWREMKARQKVELPISLVAAVPGTYTGPASRAYLYYTDEHKCWVDGLKVAITPRGGE